MSAGQYVRLFEWDYSKFAVRQRLPALVALIQGGVGKIEEEHRNLSMVFSEKNQAMQVRGASAFAPPPPPFPPPFPASFLSSFPLPYTASISASDPPRHRCLFMSAAVSVVLLFLSASLCTGVSFTTFFDYSSSMYLSSPPLLSTPPLPPSIMESFIRRVQLTASDASGIRSNNRARLSVLALACRSCVVSPSARN